MNQRAKVVAAVVLFAVAGFFIWYNRETNPLQNRLSFVCIETGKVYRLERDAVRAIPARNPDTQRDTLLPFEEATGKKMIIPRFSAGLRESMKELNKYVDESTLEVSDKPLR